VRILAVDYGQKRTGLAISDPLGIFGQPLETIAASDPKEVASRISAVCVERGVVTIVLGLPRSMDNTLGPKAEETLAFRNILASHTQVPIVTWDERLTTVQAERSLRDADMSRKKRQQRVDAVAAQIILQGYMDATRKANASKSAPD
jgi:putative Holliday junction resolvase